MSISKPFVKWAGGKKQLLNSIESMLPQDFIRRRNITYIEPFVGGGAVLFWILQNYSNITRAVINDINPDLTNVYKTIRDNKHELIEVLSDLEQQFICQNDLSLRNELFLTIRTRYNLEDKSAVERAAMFIFLNKTCFNGLYRVNKKGLFNVPYGKYVNPKICDVETIKSDSELLQRVEILTGDFTQTIDYVGDQTLFYFDPPYRPISSSSSFTSYSKEDFNDIDQLRLAEFCKQISELGCNFILSNSDSVSAENNASFFDELYNMFSIKRVAATRSINSNGAKRGSVSEILVTNNH